jgi:galactoside O-acetyltransferase
MHNAAYLSRAELEGLGFAALGENVRIHPSCVLVGCPKIRIGSHVRIDPFCVITMSADLEIGNFVHISAHASVFGAGSIHIDDFACISHGATILSSTDDLTSSFLCGPLVPAKWRRPMTSPVVLARHTVVGANSVVLPGATLEEGATVGALSLVKSRLKAWTVNAGVPSRVVGHRDGQAVLMAAHQMLAESSFGEEQ